MTRVVLLVGDGIGHDLIEPARRVLEAAAPHLDLVEAEIGYGAFQRTNDALPASTLSSVRAANASLLVAVGSPLEQVEGYRSPIVRLRRELDLFCGLRPVKGLGDSAVDLLLVRDNTEGLYAGREHVEEGRAIAQRIVTRAASTRIARVAGELATGRKGRVCVVHKANVMRETCGLFREACMHVLSEFPGIEVSELLVDHAAYRLAAHPEEFDVLVTTNLFGDVLSDVAAHAGGGLGLVTSANLGPEHALFEPVHGSAPDLAGRNLANPAATFRAAAELLRHIGRSAQAEALSHAIEHTLSAGPHTADLGGTASTSDFTEAVVSRIQPVVQAMQNSAP